MGVQKRARGAIEEFREANNETGMIFSLFSERSGLSETEYWAIVFVRDGAYTQREIGKMLCVSKQTINSAFRRLEKKGLVRLQSPEENLRVKRIYLTEEGERYAQEKIEPVLALEERVWYGELSEEERETLTALLKKYNEKMNAALLRRDGSKKE